tara:strand:+ start:438 stop:629 length:192 start_codon:yes stop_codon:yes gene_type:complete
MKQDIFNSIISGFDTVDHIPNQDITDIGNSIGHSIAKYIDGDIDDFIKGVLHGVEVYNINNKE